MVAIVAGNGLGLHSSSALGLGDKGQIGNATVGNGSDQVYVNAATGNLFIQDRDQLMIGRGPDAAINRVYNSLGQLAGDNWRPGMSKQVYGLTGAVNTTGSAVHRIDWDGADVLFNWDDTRQLYVATEGQGTRDTLSYDSSMQQWTWHSPTNQLNELYDAKNGGRITSTVDRDGNAISYFYNAQGLLSQVQTASGESTFFDYVGNNLSQLRNVTLNAQGQQVSSTAVRYTYDSLDRLSSVIVDLSPDDNSIADGDIYTTTYTYDGNSNRIASITQSDGSSVAFGYQLFGSDYRVISINQTSDIGVLRTTTLSYGLVPNGAGSITTTITDPLNIKTYLTYNAANQLIGLQTNSSYPVAIIKSQKFSYNADGQISNVTEEAPGNWAAWISYQYDARGNIVVQNGPGSATINRTYDANNNLLSETYFVNDTSVVAIPATTRYVYDANGHLQFAVSAEGRVTEYRYNNAGQQIAVIAYANNRYDVSALSPTTMLSVSNVSAWLAAVDNTAATRTDMTYDFRGNIASITQYGKLLADGSGDTSAIGDIISTNYVYDQFGRLLQRFVGANGSQQVEQTTYDGMGRVLSQTAFDGSSTLYQYDAAKHQTVMTFSNGLTRTLTYNLAGELIAMTESRAGQQLSSVQNVYDKDGQLRMTTDANGLPTYFLYNENGKKIAEIDGQGRMTEYVYPTTSGGGTDFVGTIVYATPVSATQVANLAYRITQSVASTLDSTGLRPVKTAADRVDVRYYNAHGQLSATVNPEGVVTLYSYTSADQLSISRQLANRIAISSSMALDGVLVDTADYTLDPMNDRSTAYFYDKDGLLQMQRDAEGYITEFRYNGARQKTETIRYASKTAEKAIYDLQTLQAQNTFLSLIPATTAQDIHHYYQYDARGLLRAEIDGEGYLTTYTYDGYGNVASRVQGQKINPAQLTSPQQIDISFQASAIASGGVWPQVEVWVDGVKVGTTTINSTGVATYHITASNLIPITNHTVDLVFVNADGTRSVTLQNGMFGNRPFSTLGSSVEFDEGVGSAAFDSINTRIQAADAAISLSTNGAARYVLDASQTALYWATLPGEQEQTTYEYDAYGHLIKRTTYGKNGAANASGQYTYDAQGNLTGESRIDAITGETRTTTYRYDVQGRLIGQLGGEGSAALAALGSNASAAQINAIWQSWGVQYSYDAAGHRTGMIDANGKQTLYYYNVEGQMTHIVNAQGAVIEYQYNALGDLTQTVQYATLVVPTILATLAGGIISSTLATSFTALGNDGQASRTSYTYTAKGQLASRTVVLDGSTSTTTTYNYNSFGEQISISQTIVNGSSVTNTIDYDRLGQVIKQTTDAGGLNLISQAIYDAFGRVVQSVDANGNLRSQSYDRNGNTVVVTDGLGQNTLLSYDAFGNVLTKTDRNGNTTKYAYSPFNHDITITTPEGITTTTNSNAFGDVINITDGRGNSTTFNYDLSGNLTKVTLPSGSTSSTYDHAGLLTSSTDARGVTTTYSYDAANRLLNRTVDPTGLNLVTQYVYDAKGQSISVTDPSGVNTVTQYNLGGEAVLVTVDPTGLNLQTSFTYDGMGNMLTTIQGVGSANPQTMQYVYDKAGRLVSSIVDPNKLKLTTTYTYDNNGNVVAVKDAAGNYTRYVYDANNRQQYSVDATGAVVQNGYDNEGNLTTRNAFANQINVSGLGLQLQESDVTSRITAQPQRDQSINYVYDKDGRLTYVINALGYVTQNVMDANGNVIKSIAYANPITVSGNVSNASVASALNAQTPAMHALDHVTRMVYDNANRLTYTINPLGFVTYQSVDANGNVLEKSQYSIAYTSADISITALQAWGATFTTASVRTTAWVYDNANRAVFEFDPVAVPTNYLTEFTYDASGRLLSTIRTGWSALPTITRGKNEADIRAIYAGLVNTGPVTTNAYDSAGRLLQVTNAMGVITRLEMDAIGNVTKQIIAAGTPDQSVTVMQYDAAGRMVAQTKAYGAPYAATTRYSYDGLSNLTAIIDPRGVELAEQDTAWAMGQRQAAGIVDSNGSAAAANLTDAQRAILYNKYQTNFRYDAVGREIHSDSLAGATLDKTYDAFGNMMLLETSGKGMPNSSLQYFYYDGANRNVLQWNNGAVIRTDYGASGQPSKITQYAHVVPTLGRDQMLAVSDLSALQPSASNNDAITLLEYDQLDRLTKATDAQGGIEKFAYDAFGNRTQYTNKNNAVFTYRYDLRGLMTSEILPVGGLGGRAVVNTYYYDYRGNLTCVAESSDGSGTDSRSTVFTFDLLDRQTGKKVNDQQVTDARGVFSWQNVTETQSYDARGNVITSTDRNGNTTYHYYDAADHKTAQVSPTGTLFTWEYDVNGNAIVSRIYGDPVKVASNGALPVPINSANVRETRNTYDAQNRLLSSTIMNVSTGRLDDAVGNSYVITNPNTSTITSAWEYDALGNVIASVDPYGVRTLHCYDSRGAKVMDIDALGYGTAWTRDAFGNVLTERRFAQQYPDAYTSSADPVYLATTWPQSADDRITTYEWDGNGRLLSTTVQAVAYASVDQYGRLTQQVGNAKTIYSYDKEGNLLRQIDANGSQYDFTYDAMGRQTSSILPQFTDYTGTLVRTTTVYTYTGLHDVATETIKGQHGAPDQVTTYTYSAGQLISKKNAAGVVTTFGHDAAGNNVMVQYVNPYPAGQSMYDASFQATLIAYDSGNREVSRITYTSDNGFTFSVPLNSSLNKITSVTPVREMQYNAYDEVTGRRIGGGGAGALWQEYAEYDNAGRVIRTNFNDGISHVFMYDKNGNATLKVESMEVDLRLYQPLDILHDLQLNQTFTKFDSRNQIISIQQPKVFAGAPKITFEGREIEIDGGNFANTVLSVGGWLQRPSTMMVGPSQATNGATLVGGVIDGVVTSSPGFTKWGHDHAEITLNQIFVTAPDLRGAFNNPTLIVQLSFYSYLDPDGNPTAQSVLYRMEVPVADYDGRQVSLAVDFGEMWKNGNIFNTTTTIDPETGDEITNTQVGNPQATATPDQLPGHPNWTGGALPGSSTGANQLLPMFFKYTVDFYATDVYSNTPVKIGQINDFVLSPNGTQVNYGSGATGDFPTEEFATGPTSGYPPIQSAVQNIPSNQITFADQILGPNVGTGVAYYRPAGSIGGFSVLPQKAGMDARSFVGDTSSLPDGDYDVVFIATSNVDGTLMLSDAYSLHISQEDNSSSIRPADGWPDRTQPYNPNAPFNQFGNNAVSTIHGPYQADAIGAYLTEYRSNGGNGTNIINITALRASDSTLAQSLQVRQRASADDSFGDWITVLRNPATGMFELPFADIDGSIDVEIRLFASVDASGTPLDTIEGVVKLQVGSYPSFEFDYVQYKTASVNITSQPAGTSYIGLSYIDRADPLQVKHYTNLTVQNSDTSFTWDTSALLDSEVDLTTFDITFTAYDINGIPLSMSQGSVTIGEETGFNDDGSKITKNTELYASSAPTIFQFNPVDRDGMPISGVASLQLFYRPKQKLEEIDPNTPDTTPPFTLVTLLPNAAGKFPFDASDLLESTEYEYRYIAMDLDGNVVSERFSYFLTGTRDNPATNVDIIEVIDKTGINALNITRYQSYNAFGEIATETTGRGQATFDALTNPTGRLTGNLDPAYTTTYQYNTLGKLILKSEPLVTMTLPNGFQQTVAPQTSFYYDQVGNLIGLKDANGNLSTQTWNYGLAQPAASSQWDAMGNSTTSSYDSFGNLRLFSDQLSRITRYDYDQLNQLTDVYRPTLADGTVRADHYTYDSLGNRITHTDAAGNIEKTYYDSEGRITQTVSAAGRTTLYSYVWDNSILSISGEQYGGWRKITTDANGMTMVDQLDQFGRLMGHQDLAGHTFTYAYNWAGLLQSQQGSTGQNIQYDYYSNGYVHTIKDVALGTLVEYEYDADGNRSIERTTVLAKEALHPAYLLAQAIITYDALNRVMGVEDIFYSVKYEYDAVGNRVHMAATYHDMLGNNDSVQEYWYQYDKLNRFTVTMGQLSSGQRGSSADDTSVTIVVGSSGDGVRLSYNGAGERMSATYAVDGRTETYEYDANGYLTNQYINGKLARGRTNDILGRVTEYREYDQSTGQVSASVSRTYDNDNLQLSERDNVDNRSTTFTRMADGTLLQTISKPDDGNETTVTTNYAYEWWDGAKQSRVTSQGQNNNVSGDWKPGLSQFNYDVNGNLYRVYDDGGGQTSNARAFEYQTDLQGQVLRRTEIGAASVNAQGQVIGGNSGSQHNFYYINGHRIGNVGNDGIEKVNYIEELAGKLGKGDDNSQKMYSPISTADFDENYMAINGAYPSITPGGWTVRSGDTLQSIAQAVWGDSTLWYILAEANGLTSQSELKAGQQLTVPNKVTNIHNTASTFKPYDPGQAIGNTNPTLPSPPPPPEADKGCGVIGLIIAIVVAVVVTVFTAGAAALAMGAIQGATLGTATLGGIMAAGATALTGGIGIAAGMGLAAAGAAVVGGAAGALAGQVSLNVTGNQKGIDWKGVAIGGLAAGLGSGVGQYVNSAGMFGQAVANTGNVTVGAGAQAAQMSKVGYMAVAAQGAANNVLGQGVNMALGVQSHFDWRGVAVGAISGMVGKAVGQALPKGFTDNALGKAAATFGTNIVVGAAGNAARGGSLGKNIGSIAINAVASTIGNAIVDQMASTSQGKNMTSDNKPFAQDSVGKTFDADHQARMNANPLLNSANNAAPTPTIYGEAAMNQIVDSRFQMAPGFGNDELPANYQVAMAAYGIVNDAAQMPSPSVNIREGLQFSLGEMGGGDGYESRPVHAMPQYGGYPGLEGVLDRVSDTYDSIDRNVLQPLGPMGGMEIEAGVAGLKFLSAGLRGVESAVDVGFDTSNLQSKLEGYLLDPTHPQNQTKATWFQQALGFDKSNWQDLGSQLRFDEATAIQTKSTQYGQTFDQSLPIKGANGRTIDTTFVFMKDANGVVRFITGIPTKK